MATFVDSHVHLADAAFDDDREQVIERARLTGAGALICIGESIAAAARAREIAARHPGFVYGTIGVHPHDAAGFEPARDEAALRDGVRSGAVAIGECGLDFYRDLSPRPAQLAALEMQLQLAGEVQKPVFLHERDAAAAMLEVLRRCRDQIPRGVIHCFTGDQTALRAYLDLDLHIGVTGWICDERRGQGLRQLVPLVPAHRLMLETDAPYLLPRTIRPQPRPGRNEPAFLVHVLDAVAACTGRPPAQVAAETTRTAEAFFAL